MAKMHILSETWDWKQSDFTSNYLSEKTYGFLLANIPFISTHPYPLEIIEHILNIEPHPFYKEIKKINGNPEKFVEFVKKFMENFEINKNLCILWSEKCHIKLMEKINIKNSFLENLLNSEFTIKYDNFNKKNLI